MVLFTTNLQSRIYLRTGAKPHLNIDLNLRFNLPVTVILLAARITLPSICKQACYIQQTVRASSAMVGARLAEVAEQQ